MKDELAKERENIKRNKRKPKKLPGHGGQGNKDFFSGRWEWSAGLNVEDQELFILFSKSGNTDQERNILN